MMRRIAACVIVLCLTATGAVAADPKPRDAAAAPTWRIVPDKSRLTFTALQVGQAFTGRFTRFGADLTLDPANLDAARLTATVDLASVDAGDTQRNQALPGEDWFDVAATPKATFRSHKFVKKDGHAYEVTGMLNIKGIERKVTIPFTLTPSGETAAIKGGFTIKRTDFDVGEGQWATGQWIGLDVRVGIDAVAVKPGAATPDR